jgi:hypothetical protein
VRALSRAHTLRGMGRRTYRSQVSGVVAGRFRAWTPRPAAVDEKIRLAPRRRPHMSPHRPLSARTVGLLITQRERKSRRVRFAVAEADHWWASCNAKNAPTTTEPMSKPTSAIPITTKSITQPDAQIRPAQTLPTAAPDGGGQISGARPFASRARRRQIIEIFGAPMAVSGASPPTTT